MNADAWNLLADRSQVLVHHASQLLGVLTHPVQSREPFALESIAEQAAHALQTLLDAMVAAPELAAHAQAMQRFDIALASWRRGVADADPLLARYQTALLRQAAQVVSSGLHVAALSTSEAARTRLTRRDLGGRLGAAPT